MIWPGTRGKRSWKRYAVKFTTEDLARWKGVGVWTVQRDIREGFLDPGSLESIYEWRTKKRIRKSKGREMPWLEGKRGRSRVGIDVGKMSVNVLKKSSY